MPRKLRKPLYSFDGTGITHYGGLTLFLQFCKLIGLKRFLARHVRWGWTGHRWTPSELFLRHLLMTVAGVGRIENSVTLKYNGVLAELMGMEGFPGPHALRAFLLSVGDRALEDLYAAHDVLRTILLNHPEPIYAAVVDLDTTALPVQGHPEGAVKGYVPHFFGQRCYSARLLTETRRGLTLRGELRSGSAHGVLGAASFLTEGTRLLPTHVPRQRVRVRADSAFYDKSFVQAVENQGFSYVIDVRIARPVSNRLGGLRYREFRHGYEVGEMMYQPCHWPEPVRCVVVRRVRSLVSPPATLFTLKDYAYTVQATNLDLSPEAVWRFYCDRAQQELLIRELKGHYALGKIPTRRFLANRVHLEILLWAYDVVGWFRRICLPADWQRSTLATMRRDLWNVPGYLTHSGRACHLRLPERFEHQDIFRHAQRKLARVRPLDAL